MSDELIIGMMSGTSVDGIDAVLTRFKSTSDLEVLETQFSPFDGELRKQINQLAQRNSELFRCEDSPLHKSLAKYYADASLRLLAKSGVHADKIKAIANHGQTVRHEPSYNPPFSLQLGDAQEIANLTGISTIGGFRQADLAAGGQGAPLMPAFHNCLFGQHENSYVLNIGGIANLTKLGTPTIGFDTGPGNTLMDQWILLSKGDRYDESGEWAAAGKVNVEVLERLLSDRYFQQTHPKSTGPDYFNLNWMKAHTGGLSEVDPQDIQATLLSFTVVTIRQALQQLEATQGTIYVCGGGARNGALMDMLGVQLPDFDLRKTDDLGIPADWVEAVGFAWLGYCHLHGINGNLPSVTGAEEAVILGRQYSPSITV